MAQEKERVLIQIDGNNFYHRLKELGIQNLLALNYQKITKFLLSRNNKQLVLAKYYIGAIREKEGDTQSKKLMANQIKLFNNLRNCGFEIGCGNMLKTDVYHEKGVDVLIAVDMLVGVYENLYDKIILVSSDTDLLPAINKAKALGKAIEYIGFSHKPSHAMIDRCSSSYLLRKGDLEEFIEK
ncbi:MAG: NYN domain-containing protein [Patescibacteria group bacterium]|nr:NYN domain-containing protein [Patescibacteria group bacterium]